MFLSLPLSPAVLPLLDLGGAFPGSYDAPVSGSIQGNSEIQRAAGVCPANTCTLCDPPVLEAVIDSEAWLSVAVVGADEWVEKEDAATVALAECEEANARTGVYKQAGVVLLEPHARSRRRTRLACCL
ncbi:MAG: hypothetical protein J3Q66DRAFT_108851 [Benniella sp.]|nr:MAG: hypothetical protein J3Q66DRAFT_108851 [Benniella sp.]